MGDRRVRRSDAGAATVEYVAFSLVVALVVGVVGVFVLTSSTPVGQIFRRAVCMVLTLGHGDCGGTTSADAHRPPWPCVVQASSNDGQVEVSFVVKVGENEKWLVEKLSDGRFRVIRGTGANAGVEAGVGGEVGATWNDKTVGVTLAADAGLFLGTGEGEVYYLPDQHAVDQLLKAHWQDVAEDTVVGHGPSRWLLDHLQDLVGLGYQLPEPDAHYWEAGLTAQASAEATWIAADAQAEAGLGALLGVRVNKDGTTTVYYRGTLTGSALAGTFASGQDGNTEYGQLKAEGKLQTVVEVQYDAAHHLRDVRQRAIVAGQAYAGTDPNPKASSYTETVLDLPVRSDADRLIALGYLAGLGLSASPAGPAVGPVTDAAFVRAVSDHGYLTRQEYDSNTGTYCVVVDAEVIAKVGVEGVLDTQQRSSTKAAYWDGSGWQRWQSCTGS